MVPQTNQEDDDEFGGKLRTRVSGGIHHTSNGLVSDWLACCACNNRADRDIDEHLMYDGDERRKKMRILFAGVNVGVQRLLRVFIQDYGHELESVTTGLGCMLRLRESFPDVLVMEQGLLWGGSDGVLALMRDDRELTTVPILLLQEARKKRFRCNVQTEALSSQEQSSVEDVQRLTKYLDSKSITLLSIHSELPFQSNNWRGWRGTGSSTTSNIC